MALLLAAFLLGACASRAGGASLQPGTLASAYDFGVPDNLPYGSSADVTISSGLWNADNLSDFLVCAAGETACDLFLGGSASGWLAPAVTFGPFASTSGTTGSFVGDLDGDGFDDVAIGRPYENGAGNMSGAGAVYLFFSRAGARASALGIGDADRRITGSDPSGRFGAALARAGDVDGDGIGDLWVGSQRYGLGPCLFLGSRNWSAALSQNDSALTLIDPWSYAGNSGMAILGGRDLNGDGALDVAFSNPTETTGTPSGVGSVFAFMGPLPTNGTVLNASSDSIQIWGTQNQGNLGVKLGFSPSFSAGGRRTLLVGATSAGSPPYPSILFFDTGGWRCCASLAAADAYGRVHSGAFALFDVAHNFATGADVDGDGVDDLVASVPGLQNAGANGTGIVYLFYGGRYLGGELALSEADATLVADAGESYVGQSVGLADLTGDRRAEILIREEHWTGLWNYSVLGFLGRTRNRPPSLDLRLQGEPVEGSTALILGNLTDADGDALTWSIGPPAAQAALDHGALSIRLAVPQDGNYSVWASATDGQLRANASLTFSVANLPPSCALSVPTPFVEGSLGVVQLMASDPGADNWTAAWAGPIGFGAAGDVGFFKPLDSGTFWVNVTVTDSGGAAGACSILVDVANLAPTITISGAPRIREGEVGYFLAQTQDAGPLDAVRVSWNLPSGDGHPVTSGVNWSTSRPGAYTLQATATDRHGAATTANYSVVVADVGLDVMLDMPSAPREGEPVTLRILQPSGSAFDPIRVVWDVCLAGSTSGTSFTVGRAPSGAYCVNATVTDDDGDQAVFEDFLRVQNRDPLEGIDLGGGPPYSFVEGETVSARAVVGRWETSTHVDYRWLMDGELVADNTNLSFRAVAGQHELSLVAFDGQGGANSFNLTFEVANVPPVISLDGPSIVQVDGVEVWSASASDASGLAPRIRWEVDGGVVGFGPTLGFQWSEPGTHIVAAIADDGHGGTTQASRTVSVQAPPALVPAADLSGLYFVGGSIAVGAALIARWRWSRRT